MKSYYYVYRVNNRPPTIRHAKLAEAVTEAERLSNQHPGDTFEILKAVAVTRCTQASTFWMDGEGPPEKPRYRMLEEGEIIGERDEYLEFGKWNSYNTRGSIGEEFSLSGKPNGRHHPHRRPL